MNIPKDLMYTKTHEWVRFRGASSAKIGLTDFAQQQLGDLVFVNLPQPGDTVTRGEAAADVESVKAVSDIYSPITGVVSEVNEALLDQPEMINSAPYDAWLIAVSEISDQEELLGPEDYQRLCGEEQ